MDNSGKEHIQNTASNQSENPSAGIVPPKYPEADIKNQEKENMETHANDLHKAPGHGWKHYFFEFFMLFLAVFCGFLAENKREHLVEHKRELQFIRSLKNDIEKDTTQIAANILYYNTELNYIDSIRSHFQELLAGMPTLNTIKLISQTIGFPDFVYTDGTIQQLKNAGNMRLIRKSGVADHIIKYDAIVRRGLTHQDLLNSMIVNSILAKRNYVFNIEILEKLKKEIPEAENAKPLLQSVLIVKDGNELIRLLNEYLGYKRFLEIHRANLLQIRKYAEGVLMTIKSEYGD